MDQWSIKSTNYGTVIFPKKHIEFSHIFAPSTKITSIFTFLVSTTIDNDKIHQIDIKIVFLYDNLEDKNSHGLSRIQGFAFKSKVNLVFKLSKNTCRFKHSPRACIK